MEIIGLMTKKRHIEEEIAKARTGLGSFMHIGNLQLAAEGKRNQAIDLKKNLNDKSCNVRVYQGDVDLAMMEADEAEKEFKDASDRKSELESSLHELEAELLALDITCDKETLLKIQAERESLAAQVEAVMGAIDSETVRQNELKKEPGQPLALLIGERDTLLADVALGDAVDNQKIEALNDQIKDEEDRLAQRRRSSLAHTNAIKGLERKLAEAKEQLASIEQQHKDAFFHYLCGEIEAAGIEYAKKAGELGELFTWLAAAGDVLKENGTPRTVLGIGAQNFKIPALNVKACPVYGPGYGPRWIFDYERTSRHAAVVEVIAGMEAVGIAAPVKISG